MTPATKVLLATAVASSTLLAGCSALRSRRAPTLTMEQSSLRMSMTVEADGTIDLAEHAPLLGRIEAAPILAAENRDVETVQVIQHEGRYYITAEGFRSIWEVSPEPGTTLATYRSILVSESPLSGVRISRHGPVGRACVRLDVDDGGPWYVTDEGDLDDQCL